MRREIDHPGETGGGRIAGRSAVLAASLGNLLEWYDFTVYAYFAILIGSAFFPASDAATALVQAFLTFGLGFLVRPAGAVLMGAYADKHGRKAALTLTILCMAAGTLLIAVAPPASAIGIGAPLLLLAGRALQGFSAGGEVGGALTFMVEHAPVERRGLFASYLQASMAGANVLGSLVAFVLTSTLAAPDLAAWGWRVAFLIGVLIAPVGFWLRRTLAETPEYTDFLERRPQARARPLAEMAASIRQSPGLMALAVGLSALWTAGSYGLVIFFPTWVQKVAHGSSEQAFAASTIGSLFMIGACLAGGQFADRLGQRRLLVTLTLLLAVAPHALLYVAIAAPSLPTFVLVQTALCLLVGLFNGAAPAALAGLFPVAIRATGTSIGYNLAVVLFGGFAPTILAWMMAQGQDFAPAWYVTVVAIIAFPALLRLDGAARAKPATALAKS